MQQITAEIPWHSPTQASLHTVDTFLPHINQRARLLAAAAVQITAGLMVFTAVEAFSAIGIRTLPAEARLPHLTNLEDFKKFFDAAVSTHKIVDLLVLSTCSLTMVFFILFLIVWWPKRIQSWNNQHGLSAQAAEYDIGKYLSATSAFLGCMLTLGGIYAIKVELTNLAYNFDAVNHQLSAFIFGIGVIALASGVITLHSAYHLKKRIAAREQAGINQPEAVPLVPLN
jgi:hypothetical protein